MRAYLDAGGKTAGLLVGEKMSQGGLSRTKHRVPALERWENTDIKTTVCAECAFVFVFLCVTEMNKLGDKCEGVWTSRGQFQKAGSMRALRL